MLVTHIYFNGNCKEAIKLYKTALNATVQIIIEDSNHQNVIHAEIFIHDQLLMLNDFGNNDGRSTSGGYQLSVQFDSETDLKKAYSAMQDNSISIDPLQATDYSSCVVRFIDKFDVRWGFWV